MVTIQCDNFNLDQIANSGQCFRFFQINDTMPRYNIVAFNKVLEVFQVDNTIHFNCSQEDFDSIWYHYFNLGVWYEKYGMSIDPNDKFLTAAYQYGSGIRILSQPLWETMVSFIISQRKSIPAIKTSIERLCKAYGEQIEGTEYYSFPTPTQLVDLDKDDCGLGYRLPYIRDLAQQVVNGSFDIYSLIGADYYTAKQMLLSVRGIGEKVANCILLFGLGFMQACPVDVWVQKIIDEEYDGVKPKWMDSPYAGYYQQLVFYYKRNMNKL